MLLLVLCAVLAAVTAHPSTALGSYMDAAQKTRRTEIEPNNSSQSIHENDQWCQQNIGDVPYDSFLQYLWYRIWKIIGPLDPQKIKIQQPGATLARVEMVGRIMRVASYGFIEDIKDFCRNELKLQIALQSIRDERQFCMSSVKRNDISEAISITISAFDYVCENEGWRILSFVDNGGLECLFENELTDCLRVSIASNLFNLPAPTDEDDVKKNNDQECPILFELKRCVIEKIRNCPSLFSRSFITNVLHSVILPSCIKWE